MLRNLFIASLTSTNEAELTISKGEKTLINFVIENEPQLFTKMASFWLSLAFQYQGSHSLAQSRFGLILEYILITMDENVNIALYNTEAFGNWLDFIRSLPCTKGLTSQLHSHVAGIIK